MNKNVIGAFLLLGALASAGGFVWAVSNNKISFGYNDGYEPDQPIPFSHKLHAGQMGMDCKYCHSSVNKSKHASVPALSVCMNCHLVVKTDSPWIQKLTEAYNNGETIKWKKVHLLPEHVKFNHAAHIKAFQKKKLQSEGKAVPEAVRSATSEMGLNSSDPHTGMTSGHAYTFDAGPTAQYCTHCHGQIQQMEVVKQVENLSMGWCVNCHREPENQAPVNCGTCHY